MRYSKEQNDAYLAGVRNLLRFKPDATLAELQQQLLRSTSHFFSAEYVSKLRRKVLGAQAHSLDNTTRKGAVAQFFDTAMGLRNFLIPIITEGNMLPSVKIAAIGKSFEILERSTRILIISGVLGDEKGGKLFEKLRQEKEGSSVRGETAMPLEIKEQWKRLEDLGMLTPEVPVLDTTAQEKEAEQKEAEEEKIRDAEAAEREKEEMKKRELEEIRLNFERAGRVRMMDWPDKALAFPIEVRIQRFRETWGKGEPAADWDIHWFDHKGTKEPCPI